MEKRLEMNTRRCAAGLVLAAVATACGAQSVVAAADERYPYSGRLIHRYKMSDEKGGIYSVALDEKNQPVDPAKVAAEERALRWQRLGALDDAVARRMNDLGAERLPVVLWLAHDKSAATPRPAAQGEPVSEPEIDKAYAAADAQRTATVTELLAPVLARVQAYDREARSAAPSPAIYAQLDADALKALSRDLSIDRIYLDLKAQPELAIVKATTGISVLAAQGAQATGIRVAAIEAQAGIVEPGSLLLRPVVQDFLHVCPGQVGEHATAVAGALLERKVTVFGQTAGEEGAAPGVLLRDAGSCSTSSTELMDLSTRAANWGARAVNLSWGLDTQLMLGATDRFYDDLTFNRWRTVVKSAGNRKCTATDGNVTTPGLAYNVITVGGFDDKRTVAWGDDTVDPCASFRDPISLHADRQKPEIAAPSVDVTVVTAGPANLMTVHGTSIAAPIVTATVALMIERNSRLSVWPEISRAVLMATATHNIEGSSRLSDVDGAGGLVASAAVDLLAATDRWNGQFYACGGSTPTTLPLATLAVGPRTRHRVVLSWDTDPAFEDYENQPSADIDLVVVDPYGRTVASSLSFDNTYEIVEFDSWLAGTYTIQARKFRCDKDTWLGWAWHTLPMPKMMTGGQ